MSSDHPNIINYCPNSPTNSFSQGPLPKKLLEIAAEQEERKLRTIENPALKKR